MTTDLYQVLGVSKTATSDQIRLAYLGLIRQVHPDVTSGSDESAKQVNAAYNVLFDPRQRAAYDASLLGEACPWCDARIPSTAFNSHVTNHLVEAARDGCSVCGRTPTKEFSFTANSGFILARQVHQFTGKLCATCVTGVFREMQTHNITRGPWGLFSLVMAPFYLISNWISYGSRTRMQPPKPQDREYDTTTGKGRPVFSRVPVWLVIGLFAFVGYSVVQDASNPEVSGSNGSVSGGVSNSDTGWVVGNCADVTATGMVGLTSCSGTYDAWIVAVRAVDTACPDETDFYVDLRVGVACFVEA